MELYITNLNSGTTHEQLHDAFKPLLQKFNIEIYDVQKRPGKTIAHLTIADILKARAFLTTSKNPSTATTEHPSTLPPPNHLAKFSQSKRSADPQLLRVLRKEQKDLQSKTDAKRFGKKVRDRAENPETEGSPLQFSLLECGRWHLAGIDTRFVPFYRNTVKGSLSRDNRCLVLRISGQENDIEIRVDIYTIHSGALSQSGNTRLLTIDLAVAPRIYEKASHIGDSSLHSLVLQLANPRTTNFRVSALPDALPNTTGYCLTYRLTLLPVVFPNGLRQRVSALTSYQIPVIRLTEKKLQNTQVLSFGQEVEMLEASVAALHWSFAVRFQVQALWANGALSPAEVRQLIPLMKSFGTQFGQDKLILVLRRLFSQLPSATADADFHTHLVETASAIMRQQEAYVVQEGIHSLARKSGRDEVFIHRVLVTPTGIYLYGPEEVAANRILRQHRANSDCFLRVNFADENEERIAFEKDFSNEKILYGRFLTILRDGLNIAGEQFDFLGFSHSSLRSQTCWFMRPIIQPDGSRLHAGALITSLGDFSNIRCPAKCAARIGQAFSETHSSFPIDPRIVRRLDDIKVGRYTFTDGCGTISVAAWKKLKSAASSKVQPTLYQIRYQGAKGMISLDTSLSGSQILLRDSMIKFTGSPSHELEICATNARALPFKLNRQLIKILEDLDIEDQVFQDLQDQAVQKLHTSATSAKSAVDFLSQQLSESASGLPSLLKALKEISIDVTEDNFLRDVLGALLQLQLRDIKYRSRIFVPEAKTLYGVCDETAFLREGEIFVTFFDDEGYSSCLTDVVAITRSPALHPGDIQLATAVAPPDDSTLWDLTNCVVFSQMGTRDMPSMLSGGDLDGDLYNVIFDKRLVPKQACQPAAYLPVEAVDIGRMVTPHDMTEFFVNFMQNDQLGRIATLHQVFADDTSGGTRSEVCLKLAELHSNAVDFSKSGVPVDIKQIPRAPRFRPDFMAPSASTRVEKGITRSEEPEDLEGRQRFRYYESDHILGKLYRAIDEDAFFQDLEDDNFSLFSRDAEDNVLLEIMSFVREAMDDTSWFQLQNLAVELRDYYAATMVDIMAQYAIGRSEALTEKEVFIGTILGRSGSGSRFEREQSDMLKARFNRELRDIKAWMEAQMNGKEEKVLDLAVACLHVAVSQPTNVRIGRVNTELKSFGWFAAGMCVPQLVQREIRIPSIRFGTLRVS